jgi:signal transduction histidine kinase
VARLAVPELADWCVVDTLDEDGSIRLLAVAHVDPGKEALVRELRRRYPPAVPARYGLRRVLETGQPELYPEILPAWRQAAAQDADHLRLMQALDARSSMCVPLRARGLTLGAMTFVCAASGRRYGPPDVTLAQDLADRCALALDNARLHSQLQETLRTRELFLASLAHDLKAPLTASMGYAHLVRREANKPGGPTQVRRLAGWAEIIEDSAGRAAALLDELLDIARLEAGHALSLECRPTNLVALAQRAAAAHRRGSERHRISVDAQDDALVGEWDEARVARVLDNLLGNAVKYSPDGGEIVVRLEQDGAWAVLTVADRGMGIPAEDRSRIFDRFQRGSNVAGQVKGSGVGLVVVKHVVEQHGGSVTVDSEEGVGSTFTVRLTLDQARQ